MDLAISMAIASSLKEVPAEPGDVFLGEVGLSAEVRAVTSVEPRIAEAQRLGFKRCIIAKNNLKGIKKKKGIELIGVETVNEAMEIALKR